jgi:F-type H+-transporting ATPase subunit epsilon
MGSDAKAIKLSIVTPEKTVYSNEVLEVTIPTGAGEITVLPNHIPLISTIRTGEIRVKLANNTTQPFAISSGVVEVQPSSKVVILADRSEEAQNIDLEKAEEAYKRAEKAMKQKPGAINPEYLRLEALMKKELNRVEVARKWK